MNYEQKKALYEASKSKPSDWMFRLVYDDDWFFAIVHKDFWARYHYFDDQHISRYLKEILPKGFGETMESHFRYNDDIDNKVLLKNKRAIRALLKAGFVQIS